MQVLTPEQLADLRQKANAATPGPWEKHEHCSFVITPDFPYIPKIGSTNMHEDAAFIAAANPAIILKLLDRIDFLEKEVVSYKWVAEQAWGGEIPSPYPGHHSSYEKFIENMEHHNCPCCGGSGHVDDCDKDLVDKIERLEKEADWLAGRLSNICTLIVLGYDVVSAVPTEWAKQAPNGSGSEYWREAARKAVEEQNK